MNENKEFTMYAFATLDDCGNDQAFTEFFNLMNLLSIQNTFRKIQSTRYSGTIVISLDTLEQLHSLLIEKELPIKVAIAHNLSLAQIALLWSDTLGVTFLGPDDEDTYLAGIPVDELPKLHKSHAQKLRKFQIFTAYDIKYSHLEFLKQSFNDDIIELYNEYNYSANSSLLDTVSWYKQVQNISIINEYNERIEQKSLIKKSISAIKQSSIESLNLFNYHLVGEVKTV